MGTAEVESALVLHDAVSEAAVVGYPHDLKGQGIFQTAVLGLKSPDQIKIEGPNAISFNLEKPSPILLKQQCNLANPIYQPALDQPGRRQLRRRRDALRQRRQPPGPGRSQHGSDR